MRSLRMDDPLEAFVHEGIRRSGERGYHPTTFEAMLDRHTTEVAISKLVETGEIQSGFRRLQQLRMLEWSMEAAVIYFHDRFARNTRESAEWRLRRAGFWPLPPMPTR